MMAFYMLPARAWELGIGVALAVFELDRKRLALRASDARGRRGRTAAHACAHVCARCTERFPRPCCTAVRAGHGACDRGARQFGEHAPSVFCAARFHRQNLLFVVSVALAPAGAGAYCHGGAAGRCAACCGCGFIGGCGGLVFPHRAAPAEVEHRARTASQALCSADGCDVARRGNAVAESWPSPTRAGTGSHRISVPGTASRRVPGGIARDKPDLSSRCYDTAAHATVALWGDSHAAALAPALRAAAAAQGYGFVEMAKASCPPLLGATHAVPRLPTLAASCGRFNSAVAQQVESDGRIRVVILSADWAAPLYLTRHLAGWLARRRPRGVELDARGKHR